MDTDTDKKAAAQVDAAEGNDDAKDDSPGEKDLGWSSEQKAYIESLRKESAGYRTKAKDLESKHTTLNDRFSKLETGLKTLFGGESEDEAPESKLERLSEHNAALEFHHAVAETALELGVSKADYEYFTFLLQKATSELGEGEELGEEELLEIAARAKRSANGKATSTSGKTPGMESNQEEVTLDDFAAMSLSEKTVLYNKNQKLYQELYTKAKAAKRLI